MSPALERANQHFGHTIIDVLRAVIDSKISLPPLLKMAVAQQINAICFPGAGYLLVKVLQTRRDHAGIESNVMLVKSLDDKKIYARKTMEVNDFSFSGIPNEIGFNSSFGLVPRVKDITKCGDSPKGEYY
jgi:hypothetical protein